MLTTESQVVLLLGVVPEETLPEPILPEPILPEAIRDLLRFSLSQRCNRPKLAGRCDVLRPLEPLARVGNKGEPGLVGTSVVGEGKSGQDILGGLSPNVPMLSVGVDP